MSPYDFFHSQLIKGATGQGVALRIAKLEADRYLDIFKKSSYQGKPIELLEEGIKSAVKAQKKEGANA